MTPTIDKGRDGGDRATPKTTSSEPHHSPTWPSRFRPLLMGAALGIQRFDAAVVAAALAVVGWPR